MCSQEMDSDCEGLSPFNHFFLHQHGFESFRLVGMGNHLKWQQPWRAPWWSHWSGPLTYGHTHRKSCEREGVLGVLNTLHTMWIVVWLERIVARGHWYQVQELGSGQVWWGPCEQQLVSDDCQINLMAKVLFKCIQDNAWSLAWYLG